MAEVTDKPKRKSVAFSDGNTIVDSEGKITEEMANGGNKTTAESHSGEANGDAAVDEVTDMFKDLAKKKKKKPKKEDDGEGGEKAADDGDDLDLGALKKKKKKKSSKTADLDDFDKQLAEAGETVPEEDVDVDAGDPIQGTGIWQHESTQAIPYKLLLSRFFTLLSDRHPDLVGGSGKSYKIPPPQCLREGNKKTLLANLPEICKRLKRSDEHVTSFLFAELGTSGSVDGSRRLVIKGRFQSKQIENVLRRYIVDYVVCKTCKSPDTELNKGENRLYFVTCNSCGSRRSVQAIKSGFSAQIGKRKRMQT